MPESPSLFASRGARVAAFVALAWAFLAGMLMYAQYASGLHRFGLEYAPHVIALSITRVWGPTGASLSVCTVLTGALHDWTSAGRTGGKAVRRPPVSLAVRAGAAVPLLYGPISAVAFAGAVVAGTVSDGPGLRAFVSPLGELLRSGDFGEQVAKRGTAEEDAREKGWSETDGFWDRRNH